MKIAFQGVRGAYSEVAARKYFSNNIEPQGFSHSHEVIEAVMSGEAEYGMLPVENSIVGTVVVNLDLFFHHDVFAFGESFIRIRHALLAGKESQLSDIDYVYSHPVALDQCQDFLKENNIQPISTYDTAGAAKMIADKKSKNEAAICSVLCKDYYDLNVLAENIQNVSDNYTRFFAFSRADKIPEHAASDKTTIAFQTKHHPGALVNCLNEFSSKYINLTKIESRPIPNNPFEYIFYVDFQGSTDSNLVKNCLENLKNDAKLVKVIGSYHRGERE